MVAQRHAQYAEESAEVEVLYASLEKMKSVSKKIQNSMTRLNETGRTVQDAIGPIYGNTQRLQTQNTNIDRILASIEKVKQPLDMRNKEERILRSRPDKVGLSEYIASIDRTNQALRELKATNLRSNQTAISELSGLLAVGTGNLENVLRDMLRQDSQPIEPLKQITQGSEFPRISQAKSAQLRIINTNISDYTSQVAPAGGLSPAATVYAHERGQYLTLSLQNLAISCANTARKVSADALYKPGSCAIGTYAQGIRGMYMAEYDNICPIFSREEWGVVLEATCRESLRTFTSTLRDLDAHIRNHITTDCFLAYEIIEVVSSMYVDLEAKTGALKDPMFNALKPVRETAKSSLSILLSDIKTKVSQMLQLPGDGGPLPVTTDVMARLQNMQYYELGLKSIMTSLGDGGWNRPNDMTSSNSIPTLKTFDVGADGEQLFVHYASDSIEALLTSLENKAKQLQKGKSLQGVFIANNISIVERMIRDSDLRKVMGGAQQKIDSWKRKATNLYLDSWKVDVSGFLLDMQYTSKQSARPPSTGQAVDSAAILKSLSSKDKDSIKEKFKNFNTAFDELVAKHKTLRMEPEVRGLLGREVQKFIDPLYTRFWERYHEVDKGKGKYVKYDKGQLSTILAGLG